MRVLKFGGSSVADADRIRNAAAIVAGARSRGAEWVVVSALAGVTDALVRALEGRSDSRSTARALERRHREVAERLGVRGAVLGLGRRVRDLERHLAAAAAGDPWAWELALATGERLAAALLTAALRRQGVHAEVVDATRVVAVRGEPGATRPDLDATRRRMAEVDAATVRVVPGFFGADLQGRVLTLGRGASDLSAAVLGAAGGANAVELWTDVPGVLSAPPRWVPEAAPLPHLGWAEAAWAGRLGAKVVHPEAAAVLAARRVPAEVRSTLAPWLDGTRIAGEGAAGVVVTGRRGWAAAGRDEPAALPLLPLGPVAGPGAVREGRGPEPVAVVGVVSAGREAVAGAVRALRLPVLGEVPALRGPGIALAVREALLPRTASALHRALARRTETPPAARAAAGGGR